MTARSAKRQNSIYKLQYSRIVAALIAISMLITLLSACKAKDKAGKYKKPKAGSSLSSCEIARNGEYALSWDDDAKSVQVECLKTGKVWSNISYEKYQDGSTSVYANSSLTVNVVDSTLLVSDTVTSYGAFLDDSGDIVAQKIENGVRVTYYFDIQKISIPVDYVLYEDSLTVSVNTENICEGDDSYILADFSPANLLCSCVNDCDDGYLFVPSGQGALMRTNVTPDGARKWSGEVYGDDVSMLRTETVTDQKSVRLPVFGAKENEDAVFGIIESGAGNSVISANAGNHKVGRSSVCPQFFVRGHDSYWRGSQIYGQSILTQYSKEIDKYVATVRYYFLSGENSDYNGMAKLYRSYLKKNKKLEKSNLDNKAYALSYIGGTNVSKSVAGVPTTELVALTTFNDAQNSLQRMSDSTRCVPYVRLLNYGDGGLDPKTYLGGKKINSVYGKTDELSKLLSFAKDKKTELFFDFDLIYFKENGNGVSKGSDTAKTAVRYKSVKYKASPLRIFDEKSAYYVISRNKLSDGTERVLKKADEYGFSALSLSTITNSLYSDYSLKTPAKTTMENQTFEILMRIKKEKTVASSDANAYSAGISDVIFEVPCEDDGSIYFSDTIPFYQLVYSGYIPMYSQSINFAANADQALASAASSGIGLGFTLTGKYIPQSNDLGAYKLYATPSEYVEKHINNVLIKKGFADYFSKIGDAELERYDIDSNGISISVFSNGINVYTNHGNKPCDSPVGTLSAYEFKMEGA